MEEQASYAYVVAAEDAGVRLDHYLASRSLPHTRSQLKQFIDAGACLVNGQPARPASKVHRGDAVSLTPPPPEPCTAVPEQIPLDVLYEDEHLIVVDKPAGMVVHPAPGHSRGTLVNALLGRGQLADVGDALRPGIVHRLDRDTSGVMVATKTAVAQAALAAQFADHSVQRRYLVLVSGRLAGERGTEDTLHGRHPHHRKRFSTRVRRGRRAVTHWRVLARLDGVTLVEARLETGRTHQVRVHFADMGHPVLGDQTYARPPSHEKARAQALALGRQALHARLLGFVHPVTGEPMLFETPPPTDMRAAMDALAGGMELGNIFGPRVPTEPSREDEAANTPELKESETGMTKMESCTFDLSPEDGGAEVLRSPLLALPGVVHGFASRRGGVSAGGFASLNFGKKGGDDADNVRTNLERLGARVGFDPGRCFRLSQVHGRRVVVVDEQSDPEVVCHEEADAVVTRTPGTAVGVNTADCVPVLFAAPKRGVVAAAHAGWRGVVRGVLQATAAVMIERFGCVMEELVAAQGPCIGPCCYEIGEEVAEQFADIPGVIIRQDDRPRPHLNLPAAVNYVLLDMGILRTDQPHVCTLHMDDVFFSYRRDGAGTGHHLSVIGLSR